MQDSDSTMHGGSPSATAGEMMDDMLGGSVRARAKDAGMSNSAGRSEPGTVRFCYAERDSRKEVSIFVTMAPNLTEPSSAAIPELGTVATGRISEQHHWVLR